MKISVFTGPYFRQTRSKNVWSDDSPRLLKDYRGFVVNKRGKLCATGYEMNQKKSLQPEEEFVFGSFTPPQLSVRDPGSRSN
jgi:endonuclease G, mitochondrial